MVMAGISACATKDLPVGDYVTTVDVARMQDYLLESMLRELRDELSNQLEASGAESCPWPSTAESLTLVNMGGRTEVL